MDIFGITPVDSALSVLGLNLSQGLMDFLFQESKIGYLCFCIGFCYQIYRCTKEVNYWPLLRHFCIFIACLITVGTSTRHEENISSAWEAYCPANHASRDSSICAPPALSTETLKSKIFNPHQRGSKEMPALLSFLGQSFDLFTIGIISALSRLMPDDFQYLKYPFDIQDRALDLQRKVKLGIADLSLKQKAQDFIYTHYLPALILVKNTSADPVKDLSIHGFSSTTIINKYSPDVKAQWEGLKTRIQHAINMDTTWPEIKLMLDRRYPQQGNTHRDNYFIDAVMFNEVKALDKEYAQKSNWLWQAAQGLLQSYPYAQGMANLSLYVFFPVVLCLILTFARVDFLLCWIKSLVWVKLWVLTACLAYWASLLIANAQAQLAGGIKWFWQEPYFALGAGVLVYFTPLMMFFLVFKGINFKYQQSIKEERHVAFT